MGNWNEFSQSINYFLPLLLAVVQLQKKKRKRRKRSLFKDKLKLCLRGGARVSYASWHHVSQPEKRSHKCVGQGRIRAGLKPNEAWASRWLGGSERLLFPKRVQVRFPAPTRRLEPPPTPVSRARTPHASGAQTHRQANTQTKEDLRKEHRCSKAVCKGNPPAPDCRKHLASAWGLFWGINSTNVQNPVQSLKENESHLRGPSSSLPTFLSIFILGGWP